MNANQVPDIKHHDNYFEFIGEWTQKNLNSLELKLKQLKSMSGREAILDGKGLTRLDTAGALVLQDFIRHAKKHWAKVDVVNFGEEQQFLMNLVNAQEEMLTHQPQVSTPDNFLTYVGKEVVGKYDQIKAYLAFTGQFTTMFFHSIRHFTSLQIRSFFNSIDEMGYKALPIIALLSFLIGVVLAYQLGFQLQNYGAEAFIVNLIGQAVFREFGPLITAIIGAGRTSSALTAQLGTMKINQEIDALKTMGFSPFDILVVPRVAASLIVFPLLVIWADIFGVLGGMIMTKAFFGTHYGDFLGRFNTVVDLNTLLVGLSKAPVFALIITMVGCFQGLNVSGNADSVGIQTTKSVVQAIFLVIIADALFAIIYSRLNI